MSANQIRSGDVLGSLHIKFKDLDDTGKALLEDKKFLGDMDKTCALKHKEHDARSSSAARRLSTAARAAHDGDASNASRDGAVCTVSSRGDDARSSSAAGRFSEAAAATRDGNAAHASGIVIVLSGPARVSSGSASSPASRGSSFITVRSDAEARCTVGSRTAAAAQEGRHE